MPQVLDVEAILNAHLREDEGVAALTDEIVGTTPDDISLPWARITLFGDPLVVDGVRHLIHASLQVDCYAGTLGDQSAAADLSAAVILAAEKMPETELDGAVVTSVVTSRRSNSDSSFTPPMPGYAVSVQIWMHP